MVNTKRGNIMSESLPTVFVDRNGQKVMVNASDFDPKKDKEWSDKPIPKSRPVASKNK